MTGILDIPADQYHQDPCDTPSLSASIAAILCNASPAHAHAAHPKLNPLLQRREDEKFDVGTCAHAMLLQGQEIAHVVDAPDWRTKDAREQRDQARAAGKVPLLVGVLAEVKAMVWAAQEQLAAHNAQPPLFTEGRPEQTLVWEEPGGVMCRARLDWLRDDHAAIDDLKTTSRSANPEAYARNLLSVGADVQAAFYVRGVQHIYGETPTFRWCVAETKPPYAISVIAPAPDMLDLGHRKVLYAIDTWRRCMTSGSWPGYPTEVCWAHPPDFEVARWMEHEELAAA